MTSDLQSPISNLTQLAGRKVAVLGYGVECRSAAKFLAGQGAHVTVRDKKTDLAVPQEYERRLGEDYLDGLDEFDLIVPTPGIPRSHIETMKPIVSPTQLFLEHCPAPVIGVTGTKGKGTTCTLITKMLEAAGKKVYLGGNIGTPALDFLGQIKSEDYAVLELSSFQLYDVTISPHIAVVLMVESDHLDWHPDMADYVAAKTRLTRYQKAGDVVVFHRQNQLSKQIAGASSGRKIAYLSPDGARVDDDFIVIDEQQVAKTSDVGLIGPHNLENICAALTAVWQIEKNASAYAQVIREFKGLEHRLEFVREVDGVKYYNDSFSTNPSSCIAALRSFDTPVILIAGGSDKGADFGGLALEIKNRQIKRVLVIGETGPIIGKALEKAGYGNFEECNGTMDDFVRKAHDLAVAGDTVLLSPASASFGLFKSYKQRGQLFKNAVEALEFTP